MNRRILFGIPVLLFLTAVPAPAARLRNVPVTLHQPDGESVPCFMSGDEYFRWAHDDRGFVITADPATGKLVYAADAGGHWAPSEWVAGAEDPAARGLTPGLPIPIDEVHRRVAFFHDHLAKSRPLHGGPKSGQFNNLVIFVRFSDQTDFGEPISHYDDMFNADASGANSMTNYYREASYGQLTVTTYLYPPSHDQVLAYVDGHPRSYFSPQSLTNPNGYDPANDGIEGAQRLHAMLVAAVNSIAAQVPASLDVDRDNDGYVDNVCFIIRGTSDSWSDMLWPHMWQLMDGYVASINGKQVSTYDLQLADLLNNTSYGTGVLCHEMFHSLGAPDLYRYTAGQSTYYPAGPWDLMDNNSNPPQHMTAYMKHRYGGWIPSIPLINAGGVYSLNPLTSLSNSCYRINSPNSTSQYYVVEYRSQASSGFEAGLPGSGLIVYRINEAADGQGNAEGPPDELYVYRPGGTSTAAGLVDAAAFSLGSGRTAITDATDPAGYLANGQAGGLSITGIGAAGATISFTVGGGAAPVCATRAGDANGDSQVNVGDLVATVNDILETQLLTPAARACANVAAGGSLDIFDVIGIVDLILHPGKSEPASEIGAQANEESPLLIRAERVGAEWRLTFDGSRVAGIQAALPQDETPATTPRLEGGGTGSTVAFEVRAGILRLLSFVSDGGPVAPGACTLVLPAGTWGDPMADGAAADEGMTLDGASLVSSASTLLFADMQGRALPFRLAAPSGPAAPAMASTMIVVPNPARGVMRLHLRGVVPGTLVPVRACDVAGRTVASFMTPAAGGDGSITAEWNGRDAQGTPVPTGIYLLVTGDRAGARVAKVLILH
jgi:M6 family metalloprotease-like protein